MVSPSSSQTADVIVIGGGHGGIEAAMAAARLGCKTLLMTMNLDTIGQMSCNPSIGGPAKSQLVKEVDALGGVMGLCADATYIQRRLLNASKGPAVWALRMQSDKAAYRAYARELVESVPNLFLRQSMVKELIIEQGRVVGIVDGLGVAYRASAVVITTGTFMNGVVWVGDKAVGGGRPGEAPSKGLTSQLVGLGLKTGRLKTGTPPRLDGRTIDYSGLDEQPGELDCGFFSFLPNRPEVPQVSCHITRTNEATHKIIRDNLHRSPMFMGLMEADCGPRYCPSIEDKVVRFADKDSHHLFVEPEGASTYEIYLQGFSTCLPYDVQQAMIHTLPGFSQAEMLRPACAVEYDYFPAYQLHASLMVKQLPGLFLAGQINGTSGYEEAASQGLVAGINAARFAGAQSEFTLTRSSSYIGTLIDDLITKEIIEPYRMLTSRSEYRLLLRQDNADKRLTPTGRSLGLVTDERWQAYEQRQAAIQQETERLKKTKVTPSIADPVLVKHGERLQEKTTLLELMRRPKVTYQDSVEMVAPPTKLPRELWQAVETEIKFEGYIQRQERTIQRLKAGFEAALPLGTDYLAIDQLSAEAREKLDRFQPTTLAQASRISGVDPADVQILQVLLKGGRLPVKKERKKVVPVA